MHSRAKAKIRSAPASISVFTVPIIMKSIIVKTDISQLACFGVDFRARGWPITTKILITT